MQVHQTAHEICLAEQLVVIRIGSIQRLNHRIGHINHLVCHHPQRTHILQTIGHHIRGCFIKRVSRVRGQTDIVRGELC